EACVEAAPITQGTITKSVCRFHNLPLDRSSVDMGQSYHERISQRTAKSTRDFGELPDKRDSTQEPTRGDSSLSMTPPHPVPLPLGGGEGDPARCGSKNDAFGWQAPQIVSLEKIAGDVEPPLPLGGGEGWGEGEAFVACRRSKPN